MQLFFTFLTLLCHSNAMFIGKRQAPTDSAIDFAAPTASAAADIPQAETAAAAGSFSTAADIPSFTQIPDSPVPDTVPAPADVPAATSQDLTGVVATADVIPATAAATTSQDVIAINPTATISQDVAGGAITAATSIDLAATSIQDILSSLAASPSQSTQDTAASAAQTSQDTAIPVIASTSSQDILATATATPAAVPVISSLVPAVTTVIPAVTSQVPSTPTAAVSSPTAVIPVSSPPPPPPQTSVKTSNAAAQASPASAAPFNFNSLLGSFVALSTIRDDACITNPAACKVTQGGLVDPGAIGGKTQCGASALVKTLVGLDNAHFGTDSNGVVTPVCGRTVHLFNPATGMVAFGVASDRILQNNGPGRGGSSQVDLSSHLNSQLGGNGKDNINGIHVTVLDLKAQNSPTNTAPVPVVVVNPNPGKSSHPNNPAPSAPASPAPAPAKSGTPSQIGDTFNFKTLTGNFFAFAQVQSPPSSSSQQTQCGFALNSGDLVSLDSAHFGTQSNGQKTSLCGRAVKLTNQANGKTVFGRALDRNSGNPGPGHQGGFPGVVLAKSLNLQLGGGGNNINSVSVEVI